MVKAKRKCCKSNPRCKRCPVVFKRLEAGNLAEHVGKRRWAVSPELKKKTLKQARRRAIA